MDNYSKLRENSFYNGIAGHIFAKDETILSVFNQKIEIIRNFYYKCNNRVDVIDPQYQKRE
jgi:hypothetical protein